MWQFFFTENMKRKVSLGSSCRLNRGRISSVCCAHECRAVGREFDSRGRTVTQGLKITEKWTRYFLCTASGYTFAWLGWPRKMAVPSPEGDAKKVSPISTFLLSILTLQQSAFIIIIFFNAGFSVSDIHCLLNFLTLIMARLWLLTQAVISFNFGWLKRVATLCVRSPHSHLIFSCFKTQI